MSWPTQPFPTAPPPFARQSFTEADINPHISAEDQAKVREFLRASRNEGLYTPPSLQGTIMMPGHNGGANWGSSAVGPDERPALYRLEGAADDGESARAAAAGARRRTGRRRRTARRAGPAAGGNRPPPLPPPNAGPDFIPYTAPVDFMIQPSTGLSAIGPPWSQTHGVRPEQGNDSLAGPERRRREPGGQRRHRHGQPCAARRRRRDGRRAAVHRHVVGSEVPRLRRRHGPGALELRSAGGEGRRAGRVLGGGRQYVAIAVGGNGLFSQGLDHPEPGPGQYMVFALGSNNQ